MASTAIDQIKDRIDIVDLIGQRVTLKKTGRNFKGLCPFHQEKTPSFVVFPESQHFHCFGCGKSGDLFTYYELTENVDFREALRELADRAGVEIEPDHARAVPGPDPIDVRSREILRSAAELFHQVLLASASGESARSYLDHRGVDRETIERFQLGFAPNSWDFLIKRFSAKGAEVQHLADAGLVQPRDNGGFYDRFRNRLMFPIRDRDGVVVGFGARAMGDDQPKYLNSAQSGVFDKSRLLYALDLAKESIRELDRVVIVEGYMDVIAAHQFGHRNVVATMGTAVTEAQVELIKRFSKRIVLALDADAAGQMAALRAIESIHAGLDVTEEIVPDPRTAFRIAQRLDAEITVAELPQGKDPDELIRAAPDLWDEVIESGRPYADFLIAKVTTGVDPGDPIAKRQAIDRLAPVLQLVPDHIMRSHYAQVIARRLDLPYRDVEARLQRSAPRRGDRFDRQVSRQPPAVTPQLEDHLVALLIRFRPLVFDLMSEIPTEDLLDGRNRAILALVKDPNRPDEDFDPADLRIDDPILREYAASLIQSLDARPPQLPGEVREEVLQTLMRLERDRYELLSAHLRSEIAEAERGRDDETLPNLLAQYERLSMLHRRTYPRPSPYFADTRTPVNIKRPRA